ncbi:hypothetical protein V8C86DRAFT_2732250 [Haematococcus lacustris]
MATEGVSARAGQMLAALHCLASRDVSSRLQHGASRRRSVEMRADGQLPMASTSPAARHASGSHALHRQCSWVAGGAGSRVGGGEGHTAKMGRRASVEVGPMAAVLTALQQAGQAQHLPAELSMVARGSTEVGASGGRLLACRSKSRQAGRQAGRWSVELPHPGSPPLSPPQQQMGGGDKAGGSRWSVDQGRARGCVGSARDEVGEAVPVNPCLLPPLLSSPSAPGCASGVQA